MDKSFRLLSPSDLQYTINGKFSTDPSARELIIKFAEFAQAHITLLLEEAPFDLTFTGSFSLAPKWRYTLDNRHSIPGSLPIEDLSTEQGAQIRLQSRRLELVSFKKLSLEELDWINYPEKVICFLNKLCAALKNSVISAGLWRSDLNILFWGLVSIQSACGICRNYRVIIDTYRGHFKFYLERQADQQDPALSRCTVF
jgi:hypothetical protein